MDNISSSETYTKGTKNTSKEPNVHKKELGIYQGRIKTHKGKLNVYKEELETHQGRNKN